MADSNFSYNSPSYDVNGGNYSSNSRSFRRVNGLEIIVVLLSLIAIISVFLWGLLSTNALNRDSQRQQDMSQMVSALDNFYKNSSTIPSNRKYPTAICSADLNEVDFESTLKIYLTGNKPEVDPHAYIESKNYPRDRWGTYSYQFADRKIPFRCTNILPNGSNAKAYANRDESCNFSQQLKLRKCYLYTSSNNGDTYQIGFWAESKGKFIVYKKFREDTIQIVVQ